MPSLDIPAELLERVTKKANTASPQEAVIQVLEQYAPEPSSRTGATQTSILSDFAKYPGAQAPRLGTWEAVMTLEELHEMRRAR